MKKILIQKLAFIAVAVSMFLGPLLDDPGFFTYVVIAGAVFYLSFGWFFQMINADSSPLANEIVGFVYSTVMIANCLEQFSMPGARYFTYYGEVLAVALVVFMIIKRKKVDKYMLTQSIILCLFSPIPVLLKTA